MDANFQQLSAERKKLKVILDCVTDVISFLGKQNLAFREHRRESIAGLSQNNTDQNSGNFFATIKLLAKQDPILAQRIDKCKDHAKQMTQLSSRTQNETVHFLGETIHTKILDEIREPKYYPIMMDSTSDIAHEN